MLLTKFMTNAIFRKVTHGLKQIKKASNLRSRYSCYNLRV